MIAIALGAATLQITGCAKTADDLTREAALQDARQKAKAATYHIDAHFPGTADDYAHVVGQTEGVEVMRVNGTSRYDGGVTVTVRVHGLATRVDSYGQPWQLDLPECFRLVWNDTADIARVYDTSCPTTAPLSIAKDPQLPPDIVSTLRQALTGLHSAAAIRSAIGGLPLDAGVTIDVATGNGAFGIALRASKYDCVTGRVMPAKVEVWRPEEGALEARGCTAIGATEDVGLD